MCGYLFFLVVSSIVQCGAMDVKIGIICKPCVTVFAQPQGDVLDADKEAPLHILQNNNQVSYGQRVRITKSVGSWFQIDSLDDPVFIHIKNLKECKWGYCSGWVKMKDIAIVNEFPCYNLVLTSAILNLPVGTPLVGERMGGTWKVQFHDSYTYINAQNVYEIHAFESTYNASNKLGDAFSKEEQIFDDCKEILYWCKKFGLYICDTAKSFLDKKNDGTTYRADGPTLIRLIFRLRGLIIPRNAQSQYLEAYPINPIDLMPGDLIFLKPPQECNGVVRKTFPVKYVMIYYGADSGGNDLVVDARNNNDLRLVPLQKILGILSLKKCDQGQTVKVFDSTGNVIEEPFQLFCGTFCTWSNLYKARKRWLGDYL